MRRNTLVIPLRVALAAFALMLASGCASYTGSALTAGQSTEADILAAMGQPDEKLKTASGESVWFYALPARRQTYAVTIGPDGRFRSSEQRLERSYIDQIRRDTWTTKEVRALLGPPYETTRFERQQRDVWTYRWQEFSDRRQLNVQFSYDGVVREVLDMLDPTFLRGGPSVFIHGRTRVSAR
ncbi:MAG: hypothetical protein R3357_03820 [Burkholderiales bacterium]|nr:hypothetical protein [Burkholderiales bacterium]